MIYLYEYKHTLEFEDENISEFIKVKRNRNSETYMRAQHLTQMEKIRKLQAEFAKRKYSVFFFDIL